VALSKWFNHRYKFVAGVYNLRTKEFRKTTVFLDTGCYNTLIPRDLAEQSGHSLGFKVKSSLGANLIETEAFSIDKIMIGDFVLERVVAFAGNYKGEQEYDIFLGTNVINNWEMIISKKSIRFNSARIRLTVFLTRLISIRITLTKKANTSTCRTAKLPVAWITAYKEDYWVLACICSLRSSFAVRYRE
jgi:hypothetical protein